MSARLSPPTTPLARDISNKLRLRKGTVLNGSEAHYVVRKRIAAGAFGFTYLAEVDKVVGTTHRLRRRMKVVVKTPTLDLTRRYREKLDYLKEITEQFESDFRALDKLRGLKCVAELYDVGTMLIPELDRHAPFLVQEYVEGSDLRPFLERGLPPGQRFAGFRTAAEFFRWARSITTAVLKLHQRGVIHGDLWPNNIRVRNGSPILIDFGQAAFRDFLLWATKDKERPHPYIAPERLAPSSLMGRWYVAADIFSLGGILLYLATGQDPATEEDPIGFHRRRSDDEVKNEVVERLCRANPALYRSNRGIADVISRCLRYDQHRRCSVAQEVLNDIDLFAGSVSRKERQKQLRSSIEYLARKLVGPKQKDSLFTGFLTQQIRTVAHQLREMDDGIYDLSGDSRVLTEALSRYLSVLEPGDRYFTVTTPSFWHPEKNLGVNGRFLTVNHRIGCEGVIVRRVFLLTEHEEKHDPHWKMIVSAHQKMMRDLAGRGVITEDRTEDGGGFFTGVLKVPKSKREQILREGGHFGVWLKDREIMLIFPQYREDGRIVSIRFRRSPSLWAQLQIEFRQLLKDCSSIEKYRVPRGPGRRKPTILSAGAGSAAVRPARAAVGPRSRSASKVVR